MSGDPHRCMGSPDGFTLCERAAASLDLFPTDLLVVVGGTTGVGVGGA